jgi:hypothetical protein
MGAESDALPECLLTFPSGSASMLAPSWAKQPVVVEFGMMLLSFRRGSQVVWSIALSNPCFC